MIGPGEELLLVDEALWLLRSDTGLPAYDFPIDRFLHCRHPWQRPTDVEVVGRVGAFEDYAGRYEELLRCGIRLVHTPEEHLRSSELTHWYPLIADLTPRSVWFDEAFEAGEVEKMLNWPIFVKGARQTSRHRRSLSIIHGPAALTAALAAYRDDPILRWQRVVCREFVPLRPVEDPDPDRIPSSFEFRTFWWRGELAGYGPYWWEGRRYRATEEEREAGLSVARDAATRLDVAFLVVDIAQTNDGHWIVIECNDGQESGYAGVSPLGLWEGILSIEKGRRGEPWERFHMRGKLYHYVGPEPIRLKSQGSPGGKRIESLVDLLSWLAENRVGGSRGNLVASTFVIDPEEMLRLADRRSEHVACAGGGHVLSAGEMFFSDNGKDIAVEEVSNFSTGYCPEPESWAAVGDALRRLGVTYPGRFTTEVVFRFCPECGQRNVVKDCCFECQICGNGLPEDWNFDTRQPA